MTAASQTRATRQLTKSFTAQLSGRTRGADRKVRRDSYDEEDRRAQVFRPIGDGTTAGAMAWIDAILRTAAEFDNLGRQKGGARPLGLYGLRVLEVLLGRHGKVAIDFKSGRIDPAIDTIAAVARISRTTVIRALKLLAAHKFLSWVRRTRKTGNDREAGPQREQITNAYFFTIGQLPKNVLQRFRDLLERRRRRSAAPNATGPAGAPPTAGCQDAELAATLARVGALLEDASPPDGQYPHSGIKG